ncbi:MAG TPA: hypothetical protein VMT49_08415 [Steroidobacteraceae bacterium]|nr:hypothetical protein [Steroidobacteraceae bacterium]
MNAQLGKRRRWPYALLAIVLGLAAYTWLSLTWSYSEGERVGILQKVSRKGWVCKTVEGELAQYVVSGVMPQIWEFTVRDATVARHLDQALGERVRLHYTEHRGVPSRCFGDTRYFVDGIEPVAAPAPMPATPGPGSTQEQAQ